MNRLQKFGVRAGLVAASVSPAVVFAQASDPFTAAMTSATTSVGTYAAALVGLSAVSVIFMIGMKYVKKIRGAA